MNRDEAERGILKLDPIESSKKHLKYRVVCDCGEYLGQTYLSHPHRSDDYTHLVSSIARQLRVTSPFVRELGACTKGRAEYLVERGHDHS